MKKIFTLLALTAIFNCYAQKPTFKGINEKDTALMRLQIQMPIKIMNGQKSFASIDTSVHVLVEVVTIGHHMKSNTSDFTLMLQPEMDYKITFEKKGYVSKQLLVSTKNVSTKYKYIITANVELVPGNSIVSCGKVVFNSQKANFISTVTGIRITNVKGKPFPYVY